MQSSGEVFASCAKADNFFHDMVGSKGRGVSPYFVRKVEFQENNGIQSISTVRMNDIGKKQSEPLYPRDLWTKIIEAMDMVASEFSLALVVKAQKICHLKMGKSVAGKAFSSRKSCLCKDIRNLSVIEYPLVYYAQHAHQILSVGSTMPVFNTRGPGTSTVKKRGNLTKTIFPLHKSSHAY